MIPQKRLGVYARVSTARQEEEQTIKNQIEACKEFAEKNNYIIVKEYTDEGWSGDVLARPALDTLRQEAKSKEWEAVLIYDPDRLARRYSYQELVMDELQEAGKEVFFVTVPAPKNSEDKILHGVRGIFAEYERAKIKERFRLGKLRKVKEGHILTSEALYGYTYVPKHENTHGYYIVNEEEASVVRMIFNFIADGQTTRSIMKRLHELGIKPRKSKRGVWGKSTISRLLRHKAYIGEAHWGSTYGVVPKKYVKHEQYRKIKKSSRKLKPHEEWIIIPVPPIVSTELFNKVQDQLKNNSEFSQRNTKNQYLLSGKVFCTCGSKRFGECCHSKEKHLYYRCSNRLNSYPLERTCKEKSVSAITIDTLIWENVERIISSPEVLNKELEKWKTNRQKKFQFSVINPEEIQKEIIKLRKEETRYTKAYGMGVLTVYQLKEFLNPIRDKISGYETQIVKSLKENERTIISPSKEILENFTKNVMKVISNANFEKKRAIILSVINKVISSTTSVTVYGQVELGDKIWACPHTYQENSVQTIPLVKEGTVMYKTKYKENESTAMYENSGLSSNYSNGMNSILCTNSRLHSNNRNNGDAIQENVILFEFTVNLSPQLQRVPDNGLRKLKID